MAHHSNDETEHHALSKRVETCPGSGRVRIGAPASQSIALRTVGFVSLTPCTRPFFLRRQEEGELGRQQQDLGTSTQRGSSRATAQKELPGSMGAEWVAGLWSRHPATCIHLAVQPADGAEHLSMWDTEDTTGRRQGGPLPLWRSHGGGQPLNKETKS